MDLHDKEAFLARTWLRGLPAPIIAEVATRAHMRRMSEGQRIFSRGDQPGSFYLIVTGQVRICSENANGEEMTLTLIEAGNGFGEISILDEQPRTHNADCMCDLVLLTIARADFLALLNQHPPLQWQVMRQLCRSIRMTFNVIEDNLRLKLAARLAKRLLLLAQTYGVHGEEGVTINLHLSQQELGNMMGATRQSISKQLAVWQRAGWIKQEYSRITICDAAALAAVTEVSDSP